MIIARVLAAAATAAGLAAWVAFLRADLVLSHYDAKAHLVVSRRVFDNITPGWQQIGAQKDEPRREAGRGGGRSEDAGYNHGPLG